MMLYQQFTSVLLSQLPLLVIYILVLVYAAVRGKQIPTISTLVIVAMATFILAGLINIFTGFMPALWRANLPAVPISTAYGVFTFIAGMLSAAGWVFLVAAVFLHRQDTAAGPSPLPHEEPDQPENSSAPAG